jgi:predicted nucleic acid-binding protein
MKLVIDTNIIISGLLKQSITRKILLSEFFEFYLPEIVMKEVKKYRPYIYLLSKDIGVKFPKPNF